MSTNQQYAGKNFQHSSSGIMSMIFAHIWWLWKINLYKSPYNPNDMMQTNDYHYC